MRTTVSNERLRLVGAASLLAPAFIIGGSSLSHILDPLEPLSGRVIGGVAVLGLCLPLAAGGLWIWTTDYSLDGGAVLRILGWCGAGMAPVTVFSVLVIIYQRQHGVVLAEPLGILLLIAGGGTVGGLITGVHDVLRRDAYQRQQMTADRLSRLVETAPVPIIEHGLDGTVRGWNDAAGSVFGWSSDEAIGEQLPFLSETDGSRDEFSALKDRILAGEQLTNVEIQRETRDGKLREFLLSTALIQDRGDDSLSSIIGVLVDVTQQKRQQRQLELFRTLLGHSNDCIFLVNAETAELVDVNETACNRLGYDRDQLLKLSVTDIETTLSTGEDWRAHVETLREEGSVLYEGQQKRKDGSTFPVEVNIAHVVLDQEYIVAIARDITERKEREKELTQFQQAVEHAGYAIYITDRDGTIEYANPAFEDITGYAPDEAVGNQPDILRSGEHDEEYYRRLWNTILDGQIWEDEIVNQRRSSERYIAYQTIAPIYGDDAIIGFVAIQSDMTSQHLREQRLSVLNRILRHNLKNAVNVISGNADLLLAELEDAEWRTYMNRIDDQAQTLVSLSETAQTVTKALENTQPPSQPVPVADLLDQVVDPVRDEYQDATITIDNRASDSVLIDASIEPGLEELLENALKHNDQPRPIVDIIVTRGESGEQVSIAVADDGPGIPDNERRTISHDAPEAPLQHSSGIGLWFVKWVTTALGGTVDIADTDPGGSIVTLALPVISNSGSTSAGEFSSGISGTQDEKPKLDSKQDD